MNHETHEPHESGKEAGRSRLNGRKWFMLLVAALLAGGLIWVWLADREREPSYQGRSLHEWLALYRTGPDIRDRFRTSPVEWEGKSPSSQQKEAAAAIRQIGTNALPFLVKWLEYKPPVWKQRLEAMLFRFDDWRLVSFIRGKVSQQHEIDLHGCAMLGLAILRAESSPRVQELLRLADDPDPARAYRALGALSQMGSEGLSALTRIAGDPASPNQCLALRVFAALRPLGTNVSPAIPTIVRAAFDADPDVARDAIYALCNLGLEPELSFPAFTNAFASTNENLQVHTIHHIGYFGPPSVLKPLVPSLSNCLHDADSYVRTKTVEMLTHIAPEVLTNAPPH